MKIASRPEKADTKLHVSTELQSKTTKSKPFSYSVNVLGVFSVVKNSSRNNKKKKNIYGILDEPIRRHCPPETAAVDVPSIGSDNSGGKVMNRQKTSQGGPTRYPTIKPCLILPIL